MLKQRRLNLVANEQERQAAANLAASEAAEAERGNASEAMAAEISDALPMGCQPMGSNLFSAAVDVLENRITFQEAVDRFTNKKVIIRRK